MKVNKVPYETIWLKPQNNRVIQIIDQRFLPFEFKIEDINSIEQMYIAIQDMHLRGAPLIGSAGALGMYIAAFEYEFKSGLESIIEAAKYFKSSRPTAVNLEYAVDRVLNVILKSSPKERITNALSEALSIVSEERENCKQIGLAGLELIKTISKTKKGNTVNILTHCNAGWLACIDYGTATAPIYFAHDSGIKVHVWVDETRPRNQGARLTAWELGQHGVPHTVIADNTGGHLMQHGMVDIVIVGSDRTTVTGDVANKIGTYLKALAAKDNLVPFYVALPSSTIDWNISDGVREIPIEQRNAEEVRIIEGVYNNKIIGVDILPILSPAVNYGFDVTPSRLVSGLITERGICEANKESILKLFPEKNNF